MPLYRFRADINLSPEVAAERLQAVTRKPLNLYDTISTCFRPSMAPSELFFGSVEKSRFRIYRNIRYRNSFLPSIRGCITAKEKGAHVDVLMYMNPLVAAFMAFWLFMAGQGAIADTFTHQTLAPIALFLFGIVLSMGGFFPEALKAKKMLTSLWLDDSPVIGPETKLFTDNTSVVGIKCSRCGHLNAINCGKCLYCGADIVGGQTSGE